MPLKNGVRTGFILTCKATTNQIVRHTQKVPGFAWRPPRLDDTCKSIKLQTRKHLSILRCICPETAWAQPKLTHYHIRNGDAFGHVHNKGRKQSKQSESSSNKHLHIAKPLSIAHAAADDTQSAAIKSSQTHVFVSLSRPDSGSCVLNTSMVVVYQHISHSHGLANWVSPMGWSLPSSLQCIFDRPVCILKTHRCSSLASCQDFL